MPLANRKVSWEGARKDEVQARILTDVHAERLLDQEEELHHEKPIIGLLCHQLLKRPERVAFLLLDRTLERS